MRILVFLLLVLGCAAAAPLTPERVLTLPRVGEVRLSPDGPSAGRPVLKGGQAWAAPLGRQKPVTQAPEGVENGG